MKYVKIWGVLLAVCLCSCTKYLESVPDKSLAIPSTVADYKQLLENENMFVDAPGMGEFGTDDLHLPDELLASQLVYTRNAYEWARDIFEGSTVPDWNNAYQKIYYANLVLDGLGKFNDTAASAVNLDELKGWALFCRANAFYDLEELFGQPYKPASAATDLGIPLKLSVDFGEKVTRATVAGAYQQIVKDLEQALPLLTAEHSSVNRSQPSKAAVYALLARVNLIMQNYEQALKYAEACLQLYNPLLDYNTVSPTLKVSFSPLINEIIYNSAQASFSDRNWEVDRELYESFTDNDLRKTLLFIVDPVNKNIRFKGFYSAGLTGFNGLATDEVYLIKAECNARLGHNEAALQDLNTLLIKRFKKGTYMPYTTANVNDILSLILTERRKECIFRNLRWPDLRRLNQDTKFAKTLTRVANGITYKIPPNDPRYTLPIPDDEIRSTGIAQNAR